MWYLLPSFQDETRPRVFQIGFNRCGTKTIAIFFHRNGYRAAHWQKGKLAAGIELARREGKPLLHYVGGFDVYTDMERVAQRRTIPFRVERELRRRRSAEERERPIYAFKFFRSLDRQYPGSKFILNVRNVDDWIQSRLRFGGDDGRGYRFCVHGERVHRDAEALAACWREEWETQVRDVREHFAGRPDDLLIFDIDEDDPERFGRFFAGTRWELDPSLWPWTNRTRPRNGREGGRAAGASLRPPRTLTRLGRRLRAAWARSVHALGL